MVQPHVSYRMTSYHMILCSLLLMVDCLSAVPHHHPRQAMSPGLQAPFMCTSDFTLHKAYCYRYFGMESRRAFYHAEKQCIHFRSTLVSILNQEEEEFVVQLAVNNTAFWIGLNDEEGPATRHTEGVFKWTSGEDHSDEHYHHWKTGEPNNRRHLDCVKADTSGWAMATGGCASSKLPFVCKKKACPEGFDWDGTSCDVVVIDKESGHSHWSIAIDIARCRTLFFVFLISLVITVSLVVKSWRTSAEQMPQSNQRWTNKELISTVNYRDKKSTRQSLGRVQELLHPS